MLISPPNIPSDLISIHPSTDECWHSHWLAELLSTWLALYINTCMMIRFWEIIASWLNTTVLEDISHDAKMWENICQLSTPLFFNLVDRILFCNSDLFCPMFYDLLWEQGKRENKLIVYKMPFEKSIMHAMLFLGKIYMHYVCNNLTFQLE